MRPRYDAREPEELDRWERAVQRYEDAQADEDEDGREGEDDEETGEEGEDAVAEAAEDVA